MTATPMDKTNLRRTIKQLARHYLHGRRVLVQGNDVDGSVRGDEWHIKVNPDRPMFCEQDAEFGSEWLHITGEIVLDGYRLPARVSLNLTSGDVRVSSPDKDSYVIRWTEETISLPHLGSQDAENVSTVAPSWA